MKNIFSLLPKKVVTRFAGFLANQKLPPSLLKNLIDFYCYVYKIELTNSKKTNYKTFNEFFTRDINFKNRKIDIDPKSVTSPVDGTVIRCGKIQKDEFYSAKGIDFNLKELVGEKNSKFFYNGSYISIYLSPADHHRIYAPFDGKIFNFSYFNGQLLPVNKIGLKFFPKLFCINERLLSLMQDNKKRVFGILKNRSYNCRRN